MMFEYNAVVDSVLDGDTLNVTIDLGFRLFCRMPVRLFGINAPEVHSKDPAEKAHGLQAKTRLTELVGGRQVKLVSAKPTAQGGGDKFGRYLATVWLAEGAQGKSINDQLIDLGLVKPWDGNGKKPI